MLRKKVIVITFSLIFMFLVNGLVYAENEPIKINFGAYLTGDAAAVFQETARGAEIFVEEINKNGGINGRKVELYVNDITGDVAFQREEFNRLARQGIKIFTGYWRVEMVAPLTEQYKAIIFGGMAEDEIYKQGYKYIFRPYPRLTQEGIDQVHWLKEQILPNANIPMEKARVALIYQDQEIYLSLANGFKDTWISEGFNEDQIVYFVAHSPDIKDFSAVIIKLKNLKPDIVVQLSEVAQSLLFWRQAREYGLNIPIPPIGFGSNIGTGAFYDGLGKDAEYFLSTNWAVENTSKEMAPGVDKFLELYRKKYNREHLYTCHSLGWYGMYQILFEALKTAKSVDDTDAIREALFNLDIPELTFVNGWGAKFSSPDDPLEGMVGQNTRATTVGIQWQDGEMWTVWPVAFPGKEIKIPVNTFTK